MEERAQQHAGGGEVEVGVVEHDVRGLAAELERHLLHRARGELHDAPADLGRTGERGLVDERVLASSSPARAAGAGDEVDDAGRDVGFLEDLASIERGERRERRGLDDRRSCRRPAIAGRSSSRHEEREVPRDDAGADADRARSARQFCDGRERACPRSSTSSGSFSAQVGRTTRTSRPRPGRRRTWPS